MNWFLPISLVALLSLFLLLLECLLGQWFCFLLLSLWSSLHRFFRLLDFLGFLFWWFGLVWFLFADVGSHFFFLEGLLIGLLEDHLFLFLSTLWLLLLFRLGVLGCWGIAFFILFDISAVKAIPLCFFLLLLDWSFHIFLLFILLLLLYDYFCILFALFFVVSLSSLLFFLNEMLRDAERIVHLLFGLHFQAFLPRPHQILVLFLILKRQQIFNLLIFDIPLHIHLWGHGELCRINSLSSLKLALDIPEVNYHTPINCYLSIRGDPILLAIDLHPIPTVRIGDCKRFLGDFQNCMFGRYG